MVTMNYKILIDAINLKAITVAHIKNDRLIELNFESEEMLDDVGNIYLGRINNIVESLQAYFVDYGSIKSGFLPFSSYHQKLSKDDLAIVQVMKNEKGGKGARLTGFIQLNGRYNVYMPYGSNIHNSNTVKQKSGGTDCQGIEDDLNYLKSLWDSILNSSTDSTNRSLYKTDSIIERIMLNSHINDPVIITNSKLQYDMLKKNISKVCLYDSLMPIFYAYNIMSDIKSLAKNKIPLSCGGSIVIDQTEAMVAIDVNSSSADYGSLDESSYRVNLCAATEIARQIRLRKLSGIIAIDFIDMTKEHHILSVEKQFKDQLKDIHEQVRVSRINEFGVLMLSKKRSNLSISEYLYEECESCAGNVRSIVSLANEILWDIQLSICSNPARFITVECAKRVAEYLLNDLRSVLYELELGGNRVNIIAKPDFVDQYYVSPAGIPIPILSEEKEEANEVGIRYDVPVQVEYVAYFDPTFSFIGAM